MILASFWALVTATVRGLFSGCLRRPSSGWSRSRSSQPSSLRMKSATVLIPKANPEGVIIIDATKAPVGESGEKAVVDPVHPVRRRALKGQGKEGTGGGGEVWGEKRFLPDSLPIQPTNSVRARLCS